MVAAAQNAMATNGSSASWPPPSNHFCDGAGWSVKPIPLKPAASAACAHAHDAVGGTGTPGSYGRPTIGYVVANFIAKNSSRPLSTNWFCKRRDIRGIPEPERAFGFAAPPQRVGRCSTSRLRSGLRSTLPVAVSGMASTMRTNRGDHFAPRSGWSARNASKASASNVAVVFDAPPSPGRRCGRRAPGYTTTARTPGNRAITSSTGPAAKFSPSTRNQSDDATGEEERAVVAAVAEVAGPVPAVATALGGRLGVLVVALEVRQPVAPDDLADRLFGVEQSAVVVETRPRALLAGLGIEHDDVDAFGRLAERVPSACPSTA